LISSFEEERLWAALWRVLTMLGADEHDAAERVNTMAWNR
jgi:hypothetical protein